MAPATSSQSTPIQKAHLIIGFIEEVTFDDVCIITQPSQLAMLALLTEWLPGHGLFI